MREKIEVVDQSIDTAGISNDYKECISEYIYNSFDAKASTVDIKLNKNKLEGLESLIIEDNGTGIVYEELDKTFKAFLASEKMYENEYSTHGHKGKGRFSFISFAEMAKWETIYNNGSKNIKYSITIDKKAKEYIDISELNETNEKCGTKLYISGIDCLSKEDILSSQFSEYLNDKFACFLYLNKNKGYNINIEGIPLNYMEFIDEEFSEHETINIGENQFEIDFIKWCGKISERYFFHFLNEEDKEKYRIYTSFNNKSKEFPHSVYVKSSYFNSFKEIKHKHIDGQISLNLGISQYDEVFKELKEKLTKIVEEKYKKIIRIKAPKMIKDMEDKGIFPNFKNNKYDQLKKEDLKDVITEIYAIQPRIFTGKKEQQQTIIGFLNLLLDTDEREGILNIMDSITKLTPEERNELDNVLKKTTLSRIIKTVSAVQARLKIIEILKAIVFDNTKFANEREHIQKIVQDNYWLFGEEYHLVSADKTFEVALKNYEYILNGYTSEEEYKISNEERNRRPDIFMCRKRLCTSRDENHQKEENIIIELKAPSVVLDKKIYRQIDDYMDLIIHEPKFNTRLSKWKFIMVSTKKDKYIDSLYESSENYGKEFLVRGGKDYEIYAMTWADVFKNFEINHRYILNKLQFDKEALAKEVNDISDKDGRKFVDDLTNEILNLDKCLNS
jgi:hypothetical protein